MKKLVRDGPARKTKWSGTIGEVNDRQFSQRVERLFYFSLEESGALDRFSFYVNNSNPGVDARFLTVLGFSWCLRSIT